ncbi:zinc finger protein Xfin-like [Bombus vosnesenskii]|uniref:Zinc finger protein Xfin-like n=1 Tax=Bombus vosnesenskii TaxID=207650 RepID=A0A6J3K2K3_9HYME|nr:zinc finger protein Xfin-like [Bombus vosnesenskii]
MAVPNKWENACRLCSEEKNEMLSIFGNEGVQRKVAQKLRACLPVLVYKTDPLPKQICQFCAARLDDVYEFREYCLSVYKSMHLKLLAYKDIESVQIYLEAMKNSPDPCQAQLWREKARAPPPLVPLPVSLPVESPSMPIDISQDHQNSCIESLPELPCEVEIKEMTTEPILGIGVNVYEPSHKNNIENESYNKLDIIVEQNTSLLKEESNDSKQGIQVKEEEKRTSILEQVLMGSLTMNDRKDLNSETKLSSKWWCTPCNSYYKTKESLMKHMQLHCPRKYNCRKCSACFELVEDLAKHEATNHLKVTLDFDRSVLDCDQCDRQFVSWEMLKKHRLRDHLTQINEIGSNTWCSLCNRFFPSVETYQSHIQLHEVSNYTPTKILHLTNQQSAKVLKSEEPSKEVKREHFTDATKSLTCPTCGKVCTQQSALSNHMRTHEPKRHKCDICGRSFGLFIRLAAHRMSEHSQQPTMSPVMASVEQEEALNAEREAKEAREARTRASRTRTYSEMIEREDIPNHEEPPLKRNVPLNTNAFKNVARCGICLQWFSDHTTMLTHLQTHSDNFTCKNFMCHICKKSFKEKWQLFRHEVSHKRNESASVYICTVCNKSFIDKNAYKVHQKTHIVDKTYHCPKCNKIFFKEVSLLTHQCTAEIVLGKKGVSSKSSQKSASLSNSKRYKCSKCNASFSSFQSKNSHMRVHMESSHTTVRKQDLKEESEEEKTMPKLTPETSLEYSVPPIEPKVEINEESTPPPVKRTLIRTTGGYRCGVCQSPFVLRELAVAHLRSAHPLMPYQCPYCKKRFTTQYTFTHHIKTDHPDEHEN